MNPEQEQVVESAPKQGVVTKIQPTQVTILFSVLTLLAIASVVFVMYKTPAPKTETPITPAFTALTTEEETQLQEQIAPLIAAGDMTACDQVQNDMYRKVCINNIALNKADETKDISYCQYIDGDLIPKADCERKIIFQKSTETVNISTCQEATTEALQKECENSFGIRLALEKNDPTYCDKAVSPEFCRDAVTLSVFMKDPINTECSVFESSEVIDDCEIIKPVFSTPSDTTQLMNICQKLKSPIFSQLCAFNTVMPGQGSINQ